MDVDNTIQIIDRRQIDHLFWLGGSPCAGKSSIAQILSQRYTLRVYSVDSELGRLLPLTDAERQPMLYKWTNTRWHDLWMQPQRTLLAEAIAVYTEHFHLLLEDLLTLPQDMPLLVEGTCLLPDCVVELNPEPGRTLWMIPTEDFQRERYPQRGNWMQAILADCDSPEMAFENWMDRDVAFAHWVTRRCQELGQPYKIVNGTHSIDQNADWVAEHLGLHPL